MMRSMFRTIALAAATATAATAFAADVVTVDVPFNFNSHGVSYPAGKYDVSLDMNHTLVTMASKQDTKKQMQFVTGPADLKPGAPALRIKFDGLADGSHELRTIQISTRRTSVLDARVKHGATTEVPFTSGR